jgi:hypothetical protein
LTTPLSSTHLYNCAWVVGAAADSAQVMMNKMVGRMTTKQCSTRAGASIHANDRETGL